MAALSNRSDPDCLKTERYMTLYDQYTVSVDMGFR